MGDVAEGEIRDLFVAGALDRAATAALEAYGSELLGFLVAILRSESDASEVFAQMCEDMWRGLPQFEWRSSCRTWLYTLARHAAWRHRRTPLEQRKRRVPLSQISEVADRIRSRTLPHLRSEMKDQLAEIRAELEPDDQALLILRVDRGLSWKETAQVMGADDADSDAAAARLRQRFQKVKAKIRALATKQGLLGEGNKSG
jgi:RNA polymerase sigma-70 factor (ECF subfamily)